MLLANWFLTGPPVALGLLIAWQARILFFKDTEPPPVIYLDAAAGLIGCTTWSLLWVELPESSTDIFTTVVIMSCLNVACMMVGVGSGMVANAFVAAIARRKKPRR